MTETEDWNDFDTDRATFSLQPSFPRFRSANIDQNQWSDDGFAIRSFITGRNEQPADTDADTSVISEVSENQVVQLGASRGQEPSELDPLIQHSDHQVSYSRSYLGQMGDCFGVGWVTSCMASMNWRPFAPAAAHDQPPDEERPSHGNHPGMNAGYRVTSSEVSIEETRDARLLTHIAVDFINQSKRSGNEADRDQAIKYFRRALYFCPPKDKHRLMYLSNLATALVARFLKRTTYGDVVEAVYYYKEALLLQPDGHPGRERALLNLSITLWLQYAQRGVVQDLNLAIGYHQELLRLRPLGHPERPVSQSWLGNFLLTRFERLGATQDLEDGLNQYREALHHQPLASADKAAALNGLSNGLLSLYEQRGKMADLDEGIDRIKEALLLRPPGDPLRPTSLHNLVAALLARFGQRGNPSDLDEAITFARHSMAESNPGRPFRISDLKVLTNCLTRRFEETGNKEDLEEALSYSREVLELYPEGHIGKAGALSNLAWILFVRFQEQGSRPDLDEAIVLHEKSLSLRGTGHPLRCVSLGGLAIALLTRFEASKKPGDLDEAIILNREVMLIQSESHVTRVHSLNLMANSLFARYKARGNPEDLEEAIKYYHDATDRLAGNHPDKPPMLRNLGEALESRFLLNKDSEDIRNAIKVYQQALELGPSLHPFIPQIKHRLASSYITAYKNKLPNSETLRDVAFQLLIQAADHPTASFRLRFSVCVQWVNMSQDSGWDKETCLIAYRKSLALADRHLLVVSSMTSRRELLVSSIPRSLASDAAACAIEAGRIEEAIEMLEQGRTLLWSQVGRYRTPLDALRESSPQLASELESLGQRLEHSVVKLPGKATGKDLDAESQRYRLLSENWDCLVEKIRKLEGFQRFLQPTPFAALQDAASNGPVIIINVSNLRSDAIVIRNNHDPTIVPLPNVGAGYVDDLASQFAKVVSSAPDRTGRAKIISILRLLWDDIMGPAVACLKKMGVPERSRIWLCPTSRLVTLPLHAAGPHRGQNPNLPDLFIPSYTATLSALLTSSGIGPVHSNQLESPRNLSVPPLLLIAQPGAPGASEIESVREELIRIRQAVPLVDALLDEDGCHAKVLAGLFGHRWIHFACHGSQDLLEPFRSRFHLYDEPLTLLEITQARIPDAEFAFLSACHTAAGDQNTPDETIHLAAGLQFSGFKSVIGTLYAMADIDGPHVAEHVYSHMYRQSGRVASYKDAAEGLNIATKFLKTQGVPVERWINFVHIGA